MKYKVEIHVKTSALNDSIQQWVNSGRDDNRDIGSFIFEDVDKVKLIDKQLCIKKGNDMYFYNMEDIYRVKATEIKD